MTFGDAVETVRATYAIKPGSPRETQLNAPLDGLNFFFDRNDNTLREVRADAPFAGNIESVRIGDTLDSVLAKFGQPLRAPSDFGAHKAYLFGVGSYGLRCDFDKSVRATTIFYWSNEKSPAPAAADRADTSSPAAPAVAKPAASAATLAAPRSSAGPAIATTEPDHCRSNAAQPRNDGPWCSRPWLAVHFQGRQQGVERNHDRRSFCRQYRGCADRRYARRCCCEAGPAAQTIVV